MLPDIWQSVSPEREEALAAEVKRELPLGHALAGITLRVLAVSTAHPDDVLIQIGDSRPSYGLVHLTWRAEVDPMWPLVDYYSTVEELSGWPPRVFSSQTTPPECTTSLKSQPNTLAASKKSHLGRNVRPFEAALITGLLVSILQFSMFPCNYLPWISGVAAFVAGLTAAGTVACIARARWVEAIILAVLAVLSSALTLVLHMCP